ncbi:MAG: hypothetical protein ACK5V3_06695 [Bdellovibrionales bacterium]
MKALTLIFISLRSLSAPFPTTGSSFYLDGQKNLFLAPIGIYLNLENSEAQINLNVSDKEKWIVEFPGEKQFFSMRMRTFKSDAEYERSLKLWLREYQKGGLKIVQENVSKKRPEKGWIHLEDSEGRQIFQYFTYRALTWVYFGCAGTSAEKDILQQRCSLLNSRLNFTGIIL